MNLKSKLPTRYQKYASLGIIPKLFLLPFALGFIAFILMLRPLVVAKFFKVNPWRIGHLLAEVEIVRIGALEESKVKKQIVVYYFPERRPANKFVVKIWQRALPTVRGSWGWLLYTISSKVAKTKLICEPSHIDHRGLWLSHESNLRFSSFEIERGENFLSSINCSNRNYVCLMVRDSSYLATVRKDKSFAFHDFRDAKIETYLQAAEKLTSLGYTVIRMGQIVGKEFISANPKIIDYATNGMRTEFLDVYLGAHCKFCISTGTGWDVIPTVFRRPVLYSNLMPIFAPSALSFPTIIYPKSLYSKETGARLTLKEIIERDISSTESVHGYQDAGIVIRDLSAEELVEVTIEMVRRVEGTFVETPKQKELQIRLRHILSTNLKLQPTTNYYPIRAEFASCFLSRYPNFLDGLE